MMLTSQSKSASDCRSAAFAVGNTLCPGKKNLFGGTSMVI